MDSDVVLMGVLAVVMIVTTWLSWRQRNERRDVVLLGTGAIGFTAGTAIAWLI